MRSTAKKGRTSGSIEPGNLCLGNILQVGIASFRDEIRLGDDAEAAFPQRGQRVGWRHSRVLDAVARARARHLERQPTPVRRAPVDRDLALEPDQARANKPTYSGKHQLAYDLRPEDRERIFQDPKQCGVP